MNIFSEIYTFLTKSNIINRIILINTIVFIIINIIPEHISQHLFYATNDIAFTIRNPWILVFSFFSHHNIWHYLGNMLVLYFIGNLFVSEFGEKKFLNLYLIGGVISNIGFMTYYILWGMPPASCLGASGAIYTILIATAMYLPNLEVIFYFFPMKLKWIALGAYLLSLYNIIEGTNIGGNVEHITGGTVGYIWFMIVFNPFNLAKPKIKFKEKELDLNTILDKISKNGIKSLSNKEKSFLEEKSKYL